MNLMSLIRIDAHNSNSYSKIFSGYASIIPTGVVFAYFQYAAGFEISPTSTLMAHPV